MSGRIVESPRPVSLSRRIRQEAERRMGLGILVNGAAFRADELSTQRIGELLASFKDGIVGPSGVSFRTSGGVAFSLSQQSQVQAVYDAQRRHRAACLAVSAALQAAPPQNPEADSHWPSPEKVTL